VTTRFSQKALEDGKRYGMTNEHFFVVNKKSVAIVQRRLVSEVLESLVEEKERKKGQPISPEVKARYNRMIEGHLNRGFRRLEGMLKDIELYNDQGEVKRVQLRSIGEGRFKTAAKKQKTEETNAETQATANAANAAADTATTTNTEDNPGLGAGWKLDYMGGWGRANTGKIFHRSADGTVAHELGHVALLLADEYSQFLRKPNTVDGKPSLMAVSRSGKVGPLHMEASVLPALREITGDKSWKARWTKEAVQAGRKETLEYKMEEYFRSDFGGYWKPDVMPTAVRITDSNPLIRDKKGAVVKERGKAAKLGKNEIVFLEGVAEVRKEDWSRMTLAEVMRADGSLVFTSPGNYTKLQREIVKQKANVTDPQAYLRDEHGRTMFDAEGVNPLLIPRNEKVHVQAYYWGRSEGGEPIRMAKVKRADGKVAFTSAGNLTVGATDRVTTARRARVTDRQPYLRDKNGDVVRANGQIKQLDYDEVVEVVDVKNVSRPGGRTLKLAKVKRADGSLVYTSAGNYTDIDGQ
jgi:hypothetical protein